MKNKIKYKGQFRIYIMWPLYSAILLLVLDIVLLTQNLTCAAIGAVFTLAYGAFALVFLFRKQPMLTKSMVEFASDYAQVQKELLDDMVKLALKREREEKNMLTSFDSNILQNANLSGVKGVKK